VAEEIAMAVRHQLVQGRYAPSTLYGEGHVSRRIADALAKLEPYVQKRLHYIYDEQPTTATSKDKEKATRGRKSVAIPR
jgi:hypothetical protein